MNAFGPPVSGLRLIRIVLVLVALGVIINTTGNAVLFLLNADRVDQINEERARNTYSACLETNARHDRTLAELDRLVALTPAGPRRERARAGRNNTAALIGALVPKRDCRALVARQVDIR